MFLKFDDTMILDILDPSQNLLVNGIINSYIFQCLNIYYFDFIWKILLLN
jgi:hypothetical protein